MSELTSSYVVLMSADVTGTARFYREHFGYAPTFEDDWYVSLARGSHELAVLHPDHPTIPEAYRGRTASGILLNLEVEDVDAVYAELVDREGVEIVQEIRSEEFGQRHFIVAAPDDVLIDVITPIEMTGAFAEG